MVRSLGQRRRVTLAFGFFCAMVALAGASAERGEAVAGKYKTTLTLTAQPQAPVLDRYSGILTVEASGLIQSPQKLCRSNRNVELWAKLPDGRQDQVGNSRVAPKGAFAYSNEIRFSWDNREDYRPGTTVELWAMLSKQEAQRPIGGYLLLCKRAVSPHVFVQLPYVPPPPP